MKKILIPSQAGTASYPYIHRKKLLANPKRGKTQQTQSAIALTLAFHLPSLLLDRRVITKQLTI